MGKDLRTIIGKRIRTLRLRMGMSQEELGALLGYRSSGMISQVENGLKGMDREKINRAAKIFGVPVFVMLSDKEHSDADLEMIQNLYTIMNNPNSPHYGIAKDFLASAAKMPAEEQVAHESPNEKKDRLRAEKKENFRKQVVNGQ